MNCTEKAKKRLPNPVQTATIWSKLTFWWLKPILSMGMHRIITDDDIYAVNHNMRSDDNTEIYTQLWQLELKRKNPSIMRVILKVEGVKILLLAIFYSIGELIASFMQPTCLAGFVSFFSQTDVILVTRTEAYWYATGFVCSSAFWIFFHSYALYMQMISTKVRAACGGLIYQKSLRLLKASYTADQNGLIINMLTNDLNQFDYAFIYFVDAVKCPIQSIIVMVLVYKEIDVAAIPIIAISICHAPLQMWIGKKVGQLWKKCAHQTDSRVNIMNEILMGIQVIKMYAWEYSFAKLVAKIRRDEVKIIQSWGNLMATNLTFSILSKVSLFLSLITFVCFGNVLTARTVFIVSSYSNLLGISMTFNWPVALQSISIALVSVKRLQEFLLRSESKQRSKSFNTMADSTQIKPGMNEKMCEFREESEKIVKNNTFAGEGEIEQLIPSDDPLCGKKRDQYVDTIETFIRFEKATAVWGESDNGQSNGIFEVNLEMKRGLSVIIGAVGSGKSTLLDVILGELPLDTGKVVVHGSISYAPQEHWLFDSSVRSNIVFVEDFDEQRYNRVVEVCALERDFQLLPQGDATIVGEQGSSLSGGQRARVNLARSIYKRADIYLLDDPLSAVDAHVGKHIFDKCIREFLSGRICVLVTHQLQHLHENRVILMAGGRIEAQGSFETLSSRFDVTSLQHGKDQGSGAKNGDESSIIQVSEKQSLTHNDHNDRKELQSFESINFSTYKLFFGAAQNPFIIIIVFTLLVAAQCAISGGDFFLSEWVNWEEKSIIENMHAVSSNLSTSTHTTNVSFHSWSTEVHSKSNEQKRIEFIVIYACITIIGTILHFSRSFSFYRVCLRISINLHDQMYHGISRAQMIFFNRNPSGRILNRFAKDIKNVDINIPQMAILVLDVLLIFLAVIVINVIVDRWLLVPASVMVFLFCIWRTIYFRTGQAIKRLEVLSSSPVVAHMNATLQGLHCIRAFNAGAQLKREFHEFQDHYSSCQFLSTSSLRWFSFWMDLTSLLFTFTVTFSFLLIDNEMSSGRVGLAIMSCISLTGLCQIGMRQMAELENKMISVERIVEYAKLPTEPAMESDNQHAPPKNWPFHSNIKFKSLSLRYAENSSPVLRNLSFEIGAKEKIGVVGRTGSGKSSIIQSLFRLAHNEGQILIDGVDINVIGLHDLRKNISIIPQEPVLFSGNLRFNLDPCDERNDDELWNALEKVELKTMVVALPGGMDCSVLDRGSNFSAGQRQLFCLARAILRNNRIIILDEATANVDSETEQLIQQAIRKQFADCTVITIAHRLHTIMNNDKVLVVDDGEIIEFDHPYELIQRPTGLFKQLLDQTGSATAEILTSIAREGYEKDKLLN